ncbi:glutamate--tRNA ligase [Candidatus Nomurabacteria bacterium]|nr:glutamate--tRNA ligase [Candidatus Nomurabacteria bacterium]
MDNKVVTRFPPSPTGLLQMGNIRTALYNYLFSRQNSGKFIVRIEDTDKERSKKEYEKAIFSDLKWLGLEYDGEVLKSSDRTEIYKKKLHELIEKGFAYISQETEGENREVVRFKNPGGEIKFQDLIRGEVTMDVSDLKDFIIARNINDPIYHLAVCVDDLASGITHVIRGEDHISNTPRQILIIEALGGVRPIYAHIPLILAQDKSKLSKRKHGETASLKYYIDKGYLSEAIINFLALIGWNPGGEQEIFTLDELIKEFDFSKVQKGGGILNIEKLDWLNKEHMKRMPQEEIEKSILAHLPEGMQDKTIARRLVPIIFDRISKWADVKEMAEKEELDFFFKPPAIDKAKLIYKKTAPEKITKNLHLAIQALENISENNFTAEDIKNSLMTIADSLENRGELLHPVRYALSGADKSPDPFLIAATIGKNETLSRLKKAI